MSIDWDKHSDWDWPNPFTHDITVSADDVDRLGHTNNGRYLAWLEAIAWAHIGALGCGWDVNEKLGKAMAITRTEIDYLASTYEGDHLLLGTWITESDLKVRSSRHFQLIRASDGKTVLRAKMLFSCISLKNGFIARMPAEFIEAHERGLAASEMADKWIDQPNS